MNKLILIDGNSLINRGYYATPPLSAKDGRPTNAVYAFINMLVKIIGELSPTHILVAFDRKEPTFRHIKYSDYKGTRKPMPEDLRPQIDIMKQVLDEMGIARYEQAGIEADDIIGTLAKKFTVPTVIITGDKDSFQLVDDTTSVYFTRKGISEIEVYDEDNFRSKTGISPLQIIDLKSMMGDSSDNIPGIAGVGEKTAVGLVQQYGSLEGLYSHTDELKGKLKEKVESAKEIAFLSKELATIKTDADIQITLDELKFVFPFGGRVKAIFDELDFKNLLKKKEIFSDDTPAIEDRISSDKPIPKLIKIDNIKDFDKFIKPLKIYLYIGKNISFYDDKNEYLIPIKQNFFDSGLDAAGVGKILSYLLLDEKTEVVVYAKKDILYELENFFVIPKAKITDVSLKKYVLEQSPSVKYEEILDSSDGFKDRPAYYLCVLDDEYTERLISEGSYSLYSEVELPLVDTLYSMEKCGFKIDLKSLNEMSENFSLRINGILSEIFALAGENFNPNSSKQLSKILFEKLNLKSGKKTKSGYSTSAEVLEELEGAHPIIPLILKYRQLQKLQSTYIEGFKPLIDKSTGLVHTTFYQTLTTTGRLSSREPNLQNIPVREAEGKEIRKLFISSFEGGKIVGADYSQIELRLLAHLSGCKPLIDAYNKGEDIHALTASQVFGVDLKEVTPEMRRSAKAVNFGIIYGISDFGLSKQLKISPKRAGEYIKKYFEMYPSVKEYMDANVEFARKHGYVCTLLGRRRYIREINSPNYNLRSFGERAAMNMPLQGTAADLIKIAMNKVYAAIKSAGLKSKLILQVHDELLVDTAPEEVEIVKKLLVENMESAATLKVPLVAEVECGTRWFDAK